VVERELTWGLKQAFRQAKKDSFIHSGYFYSASLSTLQRRSRTGHGYCVGVSHRSTTGNCQRWTCPRFLHGG